MIKHNLLLTARNSSCVKVMFSRACVCSPEGGYTWSQVLSEGGGWVSRVPGPLWKGVLRGGWVSRGVGGYGRGQVSQREGVGGYAREREQVSQRRRVGMPGGMHHGIGMPTLSPDLGKGGNAKGEGSIMGEEGVGMPEGRARYARGRGVSMPGVGM